jgi:3-carboxy-cis,cis-muconate cycloisomerase
VSAYVIDSRLFKDQFGTEAMRRIFSDENVVQKWLDVEAALAKVQAELGVIPEGAAAEIRRKSKVEFYDLDAMKKEMDRTSHPIVPLLRAIKDVCEGDAGEFVHWGTTTQDIMDTGTVLQIREALDEIEPNLRKMIKLAAELARTHRSTVMAARSHGQQALPITFGFKVAGWAAELNRNLERFVQMRERVLIGQFSGAVGTLAALGKDGDAVQSQLMAELGLINPPITWHTSRDSMAEITCTLAMCVASIGKIAHEIYTLQKTEVAELEEPFSTGKVGSSTMPHKRNPPTCEGIVAIARIVRGIVPMAIEGMMAEHERDKVVLQVEREYISRLFSLTDAAVKKMSYVLAGLTVRPANMRRNLDIQKGLLMSEPVMMTLGHKLGRQMAHELVYEICMEAFTNDEPLREALLKNPEISSRISESELDAMLDPSSYLGMAETFVDRVLASIDP